MFKTISLWEMEIKSRLRYHHIPIRIRTRNSDSISAGKEAKNLDFSYLVSGYTQWYSHSGQQPGKFI